MVVAVAWAVGCGDDPSTLSWTIRFENDALRARATVVEAEILEGGCTAEHVFYSALLLPGTGAGPEPGELPEGRWGFFAHAKDDACTWFAQGCTEVQLPESSGSVETLLAGIPDDPECSAQACIDGQCGDEPDCALGFADCNGEVEDGCEADLLSPETCGSCDVHCTGAAGLCGRSGDQLACLEGCPAETPTVCDGRCVDLTSDPLHCGSCGTPCNLLHAPSDCVDSACVRTGCDDGWGNCDGDDSDCETSLRTLIDCGDCGESCSLSNAVATCDSGSCEVDHCINGRGNCDGIESNGCEDRLEEAPNCGECGQDCDWYGTIASCQDGGCVVEGCTGNYQDCDGQGYNGCEANLSRDEDNCGACGTPCGHEERCSNSICQPD